MLRREFGKRKEISKNFYIFIYLFHFPFWHSFCLSNQSIEIMIFTDCNEIALYFIIKMHFLLSLICWECGKTLFHYIIKCILMSVSLRTYIIFFCHTILCGWGRAVRECILCTISDKIKTIFAFLNNNKIAHECHRKSLVFFLLKLIEKTHD